MSKASRSKRSVLDDRFLKCGECNERFWDNSKLVEHMESHAETKQLLCTICDKTFSAVQDLDKHYLLHRVLMQPFGCPACEARFGNQDQLVKHVENIHPELTIGGQEKQSPPKQSTKDTKTQKKAPPAKETVQDRGTGTRSKTRSALPQRSTRTQVRTENIKSSGSPVKSSSSPVKSPKKEVKSPKAATKKSILKVAPTPSGKKRPLVWKSPVVSPEKNIKNKNVISIQLKESPGDKRKLVGAHADSPDAKQPKLVLPSGSSNMPASSTPLRKTPVTKTKLMQSISYIYDNKTQKVKKTLEETRKSLVNALTITPVNKGPIKVVKTTRPNFIVYSPSKAAQVVQTPLSASEAFDQLLKSTATSPSKNSGGTTNIQRLSFETKKPVSPSKAQTIQLIPITNKSLLRPELTIQATSTTNPITSSLKLVKNATIVSPTGSTNIVKPIFPACTFPPGLKVTPQAPKVKIIQAPPVNKIVTSPVTKIVTSTTSPQIITIKSPNKPKPSTSSSGDAGQQLISVAEVHRDPTLKPQDLKILYPSIQLRKITEAEFRRATSKGLVKAVVNKEAEDDSITTIPDEPQPVVANKGKGVKRPARQQLSKSGATGKQPKTDSATEIDTKDTKKQLSVKEKAQKTNSAAVDAKTLRELRRLAIDMTEEATEVVVERSNRRSIESSPIKSTRNASNKTVQPVEKEAVSKPAEVRKSSRSVRPSAKAKVADSKPTKAQDVRQSKRTVAAPTKTVTRRNASKKTTVEKEILKKVIEEANLTDEENSDKLPVSPAPATASPNKVRVVTLTPEVMEKLKATVMKKTTSSTPNHIRLVVRPEVLSRIQNATLKKQAEGSPSISAVPTSEGSPLSSLNVSVVPQKIVRYGVEDLKKIKQKEQEEKEKSATKKEILKKMMTKFEEKEKKKQVKFCEKKITRFLDRHQEQHLEKLKEQLLNVRNLSLDEGVKLLHDVVALGCKTCKEVIGKSLCTMGFGDEKELEQDKAVEGLVALSMAKAKQKLNCKKSPPSKVVAKKMVNGKKVVAAVKKTVSEEPKELKKVPPKKVKPPKASFSIIECAINKADQSYSKTASDTTKSSQSKPVGQMKNPVRIPRRKVQRKPQKKEQAFENDPFVDVSIINTEEKFTIECPNCENPDCDGLHIENLF